VGAAGIVAQRVSVDLCTRGILHFSSEAGTLTMSHFRQLVYVYIKAGPLNMCKETLSIFRI
jgi:hypothetical protein